MKKSLAAGALLLMTGQVFAWEGRVEVNTPKTQLLLHAEEGQDLRIAYYGEKIADPWQVVEAGGDLDMSAMPAFGTVDMVEVASLQVQHPDGDLSLSLQVTDMATVKDDRATTTVFTLQDKLKPFTVKLYYKAYNNIDIIETWTEIVNGDRKKAIRLNRFDSGHLPIRQSDVWITHTHGDWSAEGVPTMEPLTAGMKSIRNTDGLRNTHIDAPEIMFSLDGKPQENTGRTIGAALCWAGNFELRMNTPWNSQVHHFHAGIDPQPAGYVLGAGQTFTTPHLALTYTAEGLGGVSRTFHRWARTEGMLHNGAGVRDILLNSWEGIYFDITEQRIIDMMDDIKKLGGELFVMDDGWFGDKYQRLTDNSSLGDWTVDRRKLPNGLKSLTDAARERGLKFGIWLEPEATNTTSELYEKHPEWVLQVPGRELKLGRGGTQLVLDMTNPEVQDFVFNLVDNLMTEYPEIAYIKWDANASIQNYGSTYLPKDRQGNLYIDYHLGLLSTLQRIRTKYPNLIIQDCASGGGRANYGLLPYFDEFWVSDNTDALQRVYIQWGTSYFFPANAMGQHIGKGFYHLTGRGLPIKFRCDVAMSGRLGVELQPKDMTESEYRQCTRTINDYKRIRNTVQIGELYRLVSPYDRKGVSSLMYVSEDKSSAVFFAYKLDNYYNQKLPRHRLAGLDPTAVYTVHECNVAVDGKPCPLDGKSFTGQFLMEVGIEIPLTGEYASRVLHLTRSNAVFSTTTPGSQAREALLFRLKDLQQKGTMYGHQDDPFYGLTWEYEPNRSDAKDVCGDYPAVMGFELGGIEMADAKSLDSVPFDLMRKEIIAHALRGGIVTISWHPRNPLTGGTSWDVSDKTVVASVLPGGSQHAKFQLWMNRLSTFLQSISKEAGQPIAFIFRPWHENSGSWFWWGKDLCSPEEYHALWCMLQDRLSADGLDNLVWSYSPNMSGQWTEEALTERYPGDGRVDLMGLDAYQWGEESADYERQMNADLTTLKAFSEHHGVLYALTECGNKNLVDHTWWTRVIAPLAKKYQVCYFLTWRNAPHEYFGTAPERPDAADFVKMYNDKEVLFLKDITK